MFIAFVKNFTLEKLVWSVKLNLSVKQKNFSFFFFKLILGIIIKREQTRKIIEIQRNRIAD